MTLSAAWTRIAPSVALSRSSLAAAIVGDTAYVFGGELKPRTPLDADVHAVNLKDGKVETIARPADATDSTWPSPRVGSAWTAVGDKLYLWGGRGGKAMTPSTGELWAFDTVTKSFSIVPVAASVEGEQPEDRSYHVLTSAENTLYLHAGCPAKGRLPTLHSLDLASPTPAWKQLPSAPGPGRGGTNLALIPLAKSTFARYGGFAGFEVGDFALFDVKSATWSTPACSVATANPSARSVAGFVGLPAPKPISSGGSVVAVLFLGEAESTTPDVGHDGAGFFADDSFALVSHSDGSFAWQELDVSLSDRPEGLGWFAADWWKGGDGAVLVGGLHSSNERRGDAWVLRVEEN